jgi:hypothetical protein
MYMVALPKLLRNFLHLSISPFLQGSSARAAHLLNDAQFCSICQLKLPSLILHCQQQ